MRTNHKTIYFIFLILSLLGSVPKMAISGVAFTFGKYNKTTLEAQYLYCDDQQCPGCMFSNYPDCPNPFDSEDGANCEGIHEQLNWWGWFGLLPGSGGWINFGLFTQRQTLEATVAACRQSFDEEYCLSGYGPIEGAYRIGSEFDLGQLDRQYIDRSRLGDTVPPYDNLNTFAGYCSWVATQSGVRIGTSYWHYATYAAAMYLADVTMDSTLPAKRNSATPEEVEQAKKLFIHCFVAAQSWELGAVDFPEEDYILDDAGIEPIPFLVDFTPSYYYTIRDAIDYIFPVSVKADLASWGLLKSRFGLEEDEK